ncbi:MAG: tRNA pseudouridine(65) synthase TruC [Sulfurimonadaceae bacterium]|jgi:tRNA pseudouridine65 synthase|nr:tRNA pseudouridine(65) synthase TruC [Sulfurimonadaceae bacterium]
MWKNYNLEILYKDEHIVVINKPSGLLVHKSMIDKHEIYYAMAMLRDQIGMWVYPVHRLDKPTSGVLLFALSSECARKISEQIQTIEKQYIAVVRGYTPENGVIDHPLVEKQDKITDKNAKEDKEAQEAMTCYERLATVELPHAIGKYEKTRYSLMLLTPKTGRKHQLRRHMKHISHHILGDTKYGRGEHNILIREKYDCHRLLLHATSLKMRHPYTEEELLFQASLDETFIKIFQAFSWEKHALI